MLATNGDVLKVVIPLVLARMAKTTVFCPRVRPPTAGLERLPTAAIASFYQRWPRPIALLEGLATQVANWSRCRHRRLLYFS